MPKWPTRLLTKGPKRASFGWETPPSVLDQSLLLTGAYPLPEYDRPFCLKGVGEGGWRCCALCIAREILGPTSSSFAWE